MSSSLHKPLELHFLPALHILKLQDFLSPSTVIESMDEYTTTMGTFASKITAESQITSTRHP
ncbi:hypothetical protein PGTUg99_035356 [Puccinia graminis f. sp. tritici]|uniref:Uncharacterized protein n=1 Tax=Puccinia graminis f. sp. tritici TaxID=56615 RepID=A0A5B0Q9L8_PUCGR|nr:hypothetical protein PGTUg99_035356 [Puccinia graminis f. sp. tritici]